MRLLTKSQRKQLVENGRRRLASKRKPEAIDFFPVVKLFNPLGPGVWLLTEIDPRDSGIAWGLCDLGMGFPEFGMVSLKEIESYRRRFGVGVQCDATFVPQGPISTYIAAANHAGHIVDSPA